MLYHDIMNSYLIEFELTILKVLSVLAYICVVMYTLWAK